MGGLTLASITVRNLDDEIKRSLRIRAAENGRSMEEEVRDILRKALNRPNRQSNNWARNLNSRFAEVGGLARSTE